VTSLLRLARVIATVTQLKHGGYKIIACAYASLPHDSKHREDDIHGELRHGASNSR